MSVDESFTETLDWDAAEQPLPDLSAGAAFQAGYVVALYGGSLVYDRAADHMEHTHTFSISPAHLDVMAATAAKCGYRMTVLDPGKFKKNGKAYKRATVRFTREPEVDLPLIVKTRTVSREDLVKEQTLKERMEARACPSCGSWAVATQIIIGGDGDEPPKMHCQACDHTWPTNPVT